MNTFQLSCFLAVAEHLNFARAAEELHVTQPAVTQQIHSLEKELGATLFQRTTRKVSLTAEGLAFLSDAQQIQALTHRALDRFAHPQDQPFVPFALGSVFHLHLLWLAPALRRLREELPSLHPMLQVAGGPYLQQLLEEGSLEGVLGFALPARRKSGISFQEVRRAPMVCLLPEGHPLAGRESLSLEDLSGQRLVLFDPSKPIPITTGAMSQMLGARTPAELYFAQSPEAMAALVQAGYGAGFLPDVFPPWGCGCARVPPAGHGACLPGGLLPGPPGQRSPKGAAAHPAGA